MDTHQAPTPVLPEQLPDQLRGRLPEHAAHLADEPELVAAWNHEVAERKAQAAKVQSLLAYKTRKLETNKAQHAFTRRAAEKAITRDAATILGLTETTVRRLLATAEFLAEKLPQTWDTYCAGRIDRDRALKAAAAVEDIAHRGDLLPVIDAEIADRAPDQNAGVVHKWVTARVAELDAAGFQHRYDRAQQRRYVTFRHVGNGMSRIEALIPTLIAAQVEQQLHTETRNAPRTPSSEDPSAHQSTLQDRTLTQRIADAFIHRLHRIYPDVAGEHGGPPQLDSNDAAQDGSTPAGTGPSGPPALKIGVLVPVQTLRGDCDEPALSWDRCWALPAGTTRDIALDPHAEHDWYIAGTTTSITGTGGTGGTDAAPTPAPGAVPEIRTVVHPRTGPSNQSLEDWISSADPQEDNLLTKTYQSRTAKHRQRDAILIRDGQCTHPGCTNPGWQAEIDHTHSYDTGGHTTGTNLQTLCRDCHNIKSHRLDRNTANSRRDAPTLTSTPARASPDDENDLPEWLIETRPPPHWATGDAA